jgi:hypothetical protein
MELFDGEIAFPEEPVNANVSEIHRQLNEIDNILNSNARMNNNNRNSNEVNPNANNNNEGSVPVSNNNRNVAESNNTNNLNNVSQNIQQSKELVISQSRKSSYEDDKYKPEEIPVDYNINNNEIESPHLNIVT